MRIIELQFHKEVKSKKLVSAVKRSEMDLEGGKIPYIPKEDFNDLIGKVLNRRRKNKWTPRKH